MQFKKKTYGESKWQSSPKIQNELINLSEKTVRDESVPLENNFVGFSILVNETADVSEMEQLAVGARFFDKKICLFVRSFLVLCL